MLRHAAVTWGMSVREFFDPVEKAPKGRLGRRSRNRQRLDVPMAKGRRMFPRFGDLSGGSTGLFAVFTKIGLNTVNILRLELRVQSQHSLPASADGGRYLTVRTVQETERWTKMSTFLI